MAKKRKKTQWEKNRERLGKLLSEAEKTIREYEGAGQKVNRAYQLNTLSEVQQMYFSGKRISSKQLKYYGNLISKRVIREQVKLEAQSSASRKKEKAKAFKEAIEYAQKHHNNYDIDNALFRVEKGLEYDNIDAIDFESKKGEKYEYKKIEDIDVEALENMSDTTEKAIDKFLALPYASEENYEQYEDEFSKQRFSTYLGRAGVDFEKQVNLINLIDTSTFWKMVSKGYKDSDQAASEADEILFSLNTTEKIEEFAKELNNGNFNSTSDFDLWLKANYS